MKENDQSISWMDIINPFIKSDKMINLKKKLQLERSRYNVLPDAKNTFEAFKLCPYEKTRVVIIGQDPYPSSKDAHGLAFSSLNNEMPDSLRNIFTEIHRNLYPNQSFKECFKSNNLSGWAEQGVLLINSCMTVRENHPGSHKDIGWEIFMEHIIEHIFNHPNNPIVLSLGSQASSLYKYVPNNMHMLWIATGHPSPRSAHKFFFGCQAFRHINNELQRRYFEDMKMTVYDENYITMVANTSKSFLDRNGYKVPLKDLKANAKFYLEGLLPSMTEQYSAIRNKFEINWRT